MLYVRLSDEPVQDVSAFQERILQRTQNKS